WVLWGDRVQRPRSLVLARELDDRWEAFGAGEPWPALPWLLDGDLRTRVTLVGPPSWHEAIARMDGTTEQGTLETWHPPDMVRPGALASGAEDLVRAVEQRDQASFVASTPTWALRAWLSFGRMCRETVAFGIPLRDGRGFASVAWVYELSRPFAAVAVATRPRYQRLGLGGTVVRTLLRTMMSGPVEQRLTPIWFTEGSNTASKALAASLG